MNPVFFKLETRIMRKALKNLIIVLLFCSRRFMTIDFKLNYASGGGGTTPSCCNNPNSSTFAHLSAILPSSFIRTVVVPVNVKLFPLAGIPMTPPASVPVKLQR